jgi:hypothetical protein
VSAVLRRALLWLGVAAFLLTTGWQFVLGEPTGLAGFTGWPVVGAIILGSRPGNLVGWHLYGIGLLWTAATLFSIAGGIVDTGGLGGSSGTATGAPWVEALQLGVAWPGWVLLPLVGLLFPTGRIESRLGLVIAWQVIGFAAVTGVLSVIGTRMLALNGAPNPLLVEPAVPVTEFVTGPFGFAYFGLLVLVILVDLAVRWRRATGAARLQYRWLVFGLAIAVVFVVVSGMLNAVLPGEFWVQIWSGASLVVMNGIPIAIGIAVTRHGLYDIGRVISRTVSYAIVTLLVVGVYIGIVTGLTALLPGLPSVGVALATLASAALFLPVVRWIRRQVDRRFDRERYDAEQVVRTFGEHLRTEPDPERANGELVSAVERTLQPTAMGVWTPWSAR